MGTRSSTIIMQDGEPLVQIYRQMDGYPTGQGLDLAKLCDVQIVNGYGQGMKAGTHANGMGCLAAQIIAGLKGNEIGHIYIETIGPNDWCDYTYIVSGEAGKHPVIECRDSGGGAVFTGTAKEWLAHDWTKEDE